MKRQTIFCKHYRAASNHADCEAGVRYDTFKGTTGGILAWPCLRRGDQPEPCTCPLALFPTPEEIAAEDAEREARSQRIGMAREAIVKHLGGPWSKKHPKGGAGTIDCPACGAAKTLSFTRAGYNGHIHAGCSTPGCVRWME